MQERTTSDNNFEHCVKCRICVDVCPALKANPLFAGPKSAGPDGERLRLFDPEYYDSSLKICLNCKRCEQACPSDVHIADIIQSAKVKYGHIKPNLRDYMMASTDLTGSLARPVAPIANAMLGNTVVKKIMHSVMGVDKHCTMPKYASRSFEQWFRMEASRYQDKFPLSVNYFHGCYVQNNYPQLGKDLVKVLNSLGYGVELVRGEKCCGIPMISAGMLDKAREHAAHNIKALEETTGPVLLTSTSCALMLRDEYAGLLGMDNSKIRDRISHAVRFVVECLENGAQLKLRNLGGVRVAYHVPCHQEALGWSYFTRKLLGTIPGLELIELDSNCCGIAGTYGFKTENFQTAQKVGKPLFDQIAAIHPDYVACECETCKWQIEMSTGFEVKNPITILAEALQ